MSSIPAGSNRAGFMVDTVLSEIEYTDLPESTDLRPNVPTILSAPPNIQGMLLYI
jgi:hypothetical protein